eukprot:SAG11_NODE_717_length_7606_cov_5.968563_6_plen_122_part_00
MLAKPSGWTIRSAVELETKFTYVERVCSYTDLPTEPPRHKPETDPPLGHFPSAGKLELAGAELRYRPGLPLALRGVSLSIVAGEAMALHRGNFVACLCSLLPCFALRCLLILGCTASLFLA